ncbi:hypothetical protein FRC15_004855 [Serendipita sp. 397]|nr:hypothetical protein FRC15_004855 [Serendipita sp. 397]
MESQQILLAFLSTPAAQPFLTSITSRVVPALVKDAYNPHGLARTLMDMISKELDSLCLGDGEDRQEQNTSFGSNSLPHERFVREVREYWFTLVGDSNRIAGGAPPLDLTSRPTNNRSHGSPAIPSPMHVQLLATAYNNVAYRWTTDFLLYPIGKRYRQLISRGHKRRSKPPVVIQQQRAPHAQPQPPRPSSQEPAHRGESGAESSQTRAKVHKFHPYERHITSTSPSTSARARERTRIEKEMGAVNDPPLPSASSVHTRERAGTATSTTSTGTGHPHNRRKRRFPLPRRSPTEPENVSNVTAPEEGEGGVVALAPPAELKEDTAERKHESEREKDRRDNTRHIGVESMVDEVKGLEGCKFVNEENDLSTWLPEDPGYYLPLHHHYGPVVLSDIGGREPQVMVPMPPPPPSNPLGAWNADHPTLPGDEHGSGYVKQEEESWHGPALDIRAGEWREVLKYEITRRDGPGCAISKLPSLALPGHPAGGENIPTFQLLEPIYCTQIIPESHDIDRLLRFKALATVFFAGKYDSLLESAADYSESSTNTRRGSGASIIQTRRKSSGSYASPSAPSRRGHYPIPANLLRSSRNVINLSEKWMRWFDEGRFVLRERYGQFYVRCMDPELARDPSFTRQVVVPATPAGPGLKVESVDGIRLDIGATVPVSSSPSRETKHIPSSLPPSSYSRPWDHPSDPARRPHHVYQQRYPYHQELPPISSILLQNPHSHPHPHPHSHPQGASVSIHTLPPFHNPLPTPNPTPPSPPFHGQSLYHSPPLTFRHLPENTLPSSRGDDASEYGASLPGAAWNHPAESEFPLSPSQGSSRRSATHSRWRSHSESQGIITPSTTYSASNQSHYSPGSKRSALPGPFAAGRASRDVYLHSRSSSAGRGGVSGEWAPVFIPGSVTASMSLASPPLSASSSRKHSLSTLLNPQASLESVSGRKTSIKSPIMVHQMLPPRQPPVFSPLSHPRMTLPQPKIPIHSIVGSSTASTSPSTSAAPTMLAFNPPRKELWDVDALDPNLVRMHEEIMLTWWSTGLARDMANQIRDVDEARPLECMNVLALGEESFTDHLKHRLSLL